MYGTHQKCFSQDDVYHYQRQAQEAQEDLERHWQEEREAQERRREERQQAYEERLRMADDWYTALQHQSLLYGRETNLDDETDQYFTHGKEACQRAMEIYQAVEKEVQPQIDELRRQIAQLEFEVRQRTGERLAVEAQGKAPSWEQVAATLQDEDADIERWLDW